MVSWLQQNVLRTFIFIFFIHRIQVVYGVISDLLNQGIRVGWTVSKKFGCESVDAVSSVITKHMEFITGTIKYEPRIILSVGEAPVSLTSKPSFFFSLDCIFSWLHVFWRPACFCVWSNKCCRDKCSNLSQAVISLSSHAAERNNKRLAVALQAA